MRVIIALELSDEDLTEAYGTADLTDPTDQDDLLRSLAARLEEAGYFGPVNMPVRGEVLAVGDVSGEHALGDLLDSAEIGADGLALQRGVDRRRHILGTLADIRSQLA